LASALRILLVDVLAWRRFVALLVRMRFDCDVVDEATDGIEAVQKATELQPDLILLETGLPRLNGFQAARRIRKLSAKSKILFFSQLHDPEIVRAALAAGASGYVVKWDAGSELLTGITAVLEGKQFLSSKVRAAVSARSGSSDKPPSSAETRSSSHEG
jgi:DNA-binding NarL/FixJ family response regulator